LTPNYDETLVKFDNNVTLRRYVWATHVFLVEPAINPSLTEQAIGRSWRMGQKREVTVKHLVVANSIESNILKLIKERGQGPGGGGAEGAGGEGAGGADEEMELDAAAAAAEAEKKMTNAELAGHLKVGTLSAASG
jgi:hypothetical protein